MSYSPTRVRSEARRAAAPARRGVRFGLGVLVWLVASVAQAGDDGAAEADALGRSGRLAEASAAWRGVVEARHASGDARGEVEARLHLSETQQALGRYHDAVAVLGPARELAQQADDPVLLASVHGALGAARTATGPEAAARADFERALALLDGAGATRTEAVVWLNLGNLEAGSGRADAALRAYGRSARRAEDAGDTTLAVRAHVNAAAVGVRARTDAREVREHLDAAASGADAIPTSRDGVYLLVSAGRSAAELAGGRPTGDLRRAHAALTRAEAMAAELGDPLAASWAVGSLGALYEARERADDALRLTRRALFLAQEAASPESLYRWQWQLGRLLRARGDTAGAIGSYQAAVATLDTIRFEMASGYGVGQGGFREAVEPVFFELVDLLLASAPDPSDVAAYQQRLLDARSTVEDLKAAELRDYFRDECVDQAQARVASLDTVAGGAAILYPILLDDRAEMLLTLPSGLSRATAPVGRAELTKAARSLRIGLQDPASSAWQRPARRLYEWLVAPIEAELAAAGIDTLVFVPDGALRSIPMGALHDGKRFLIERYAVAITPGLTLTDPRPLDRENLRVFLSGISQSVDGFPPLPAVPDELTRIQQELNGGEQLLDEVFTLERTEQTLREQDFNVVHIATHGQFQQQVDDSFLLAWDGRLTMDKLRDYVGLFRFRETPIELLTLSACETAVGDDRAALGLAGVAIQAGARSALGSLWQVSDEATAELIVDFYARLQAEPISKAEALRRAQRALIADDDFAHPAYWSPFLLISNWL